MTPSGVGCGSSALTWGPAGSEITQKRCLETGDMPVMELCRQSPCSSISLLGVAGVRHIVIVDVGSMIGVDAIVITRTFVGTLSFNRLRSVTGHRHVAVLSFASNSQNATNRGVPHLRSDQPSEVSACVGKQSPAQLYRATNAHPRAARWSRTPGGPLTSSQSVSQANSPARVCSSRPRITISISDPPRRCCYPAFQSGHSSPHPSRLCRSGL